MLRLVDVSHAYGDVVSLRRLSLELTAGEILCLLGPSGCGKTTLLRIIAGLERDYSGEIQLDGVDIRPVLAHERGFGLMFQDYALFPHLSARENIAYGLKRRGDNRRDIQRQVGDWLERVGLAGLGGRDVTALSGGQMQRVALARSLAPNPRLLMLDEPLGSLDAQLRDQLALELRTLLKAAGISAIYVTHDRREAYAIADRIAIMDAGSIQQCDSPRQLYHAPATGQVARFLGLRNLYSRADNAAIWKLAEQAGALRSDTQHILIHPRGISLGRPTAAPAIGYAATFLEAVFRGENWDICLRLEGDWQLTFSAREVPAQVGEPVRVFVALGCVLALAG
ncbi:MAG: ABC transporter ATP-binding protein [Chloroflexi bacterium]|nr:ABC transporter ATP-binding protein [Chloroflexota bacterium]MCY3716066.1 ABC transporter ATP-binding protein [Chloroflexota bacterium]